MNPTDWVCTTDLYVKGRIICKNFQSSNELEQTGREIRQYVDTQHYQLAQLIEAQAKIIKELRERIEAIEKNET
jgi:hypothetical protein